MKIRLLAIVLCCLFLCFITAALSAKILGCTFFTACDPMSDFFVFYASNLRASLFTGFLTLGGFLMSLKTFIIVNMKKEVYDSEAYRARLKIQNVDLTPEKLYRPLKQLSEMIFITIIFCITTSVAQLTIGLFHYFIAAVLCLYLAATTIILLSYTLMLIRQNLMDMFDHLARK